ncbi:MAG: DUF3090 family protein [Actinomycetes bacterium]
MSFEFAEVDRFVTGTVGEPGERQFFLQVRSSQRLISAAIEKSQALTMAQRLELLVKQVLKEDSSLRSKTLQRDDLPLEQPIERDFVIGAISIAWESVKERVEIELYAVTEVDVQDDLEVEDNDEQAELTFSLSISQAQAFVTRTIAVVNAGRLPCPFCAIPIDPRGHLCPRANGYRR